MDPWTPDGHAALARADLDEVRRLERLSARSWPALETAPLGGWVLRASGGVTRRINSAWPLAAHTLTVDQLLRATTAWYAARGLPPRIQLSPANQPADLAQHLDGWTIGGETLVLTGTVTGIADPAVHVSPVVTETWFGIAAVTSESHFGGSLESPGRAVLQGISKTCGYAVAYADGQPVGVARAVVDGEDVGIFSVGVLPDHRRGGHGRRLMSALGAWASAQGAVRTWLQVETANAPALALYDGMTPSFTYAYATLS